jgi:hypothetical protein
LGPALAAYLRRFADCFVQDRTREHLPTSGRGLLSDLPRQRGEPIALAAGTAVRTLQEFLRDHVWDHDRLRDPLQQHPAQPDAPDGGDDLGCVGLTDETGKATKGMKPPGVPRQGCGAGGKRANGSVTVQLGLARGRFKALRDADLLLPKAWSADRARCRQAGIPDGVVYRPKGRSALEQLDRAQANGVRFDGLSFAENQGSRRAFLEDLGGRPGLSYVGEVPRSFRCPAVRPRGKPPPRGWKGKRADNRLRFSAALQRGPWHGFPQARLTVASQEWEVRAGQVYRVRRGQWSGRTSWLIQARKGATGEVKYFGSKASADTPLERLLRLALRRWPVGHAFGSTRQSVWKSA